MKLHSINDLNRTTGVCAQSPARKVEALPFLDFPKQFFWIFFFFLQLFFFLFFF